MSKITTWTFYGKRFFALVTHDFDEVTIVDENDRNYGKFHSADRFRKLQKREARNPPNRPYTTNAKRKVKSFIVDSYPN